MQQALWRPLHVVCTWRGAKSRKVPKGQVQRLWSIKDVRRAYITDHIPSLAARLAQLQRFSVFTRLTDATDSRLIYLFRTCEDVYEAKMLTVLRYRVSGLRAVDKRPSRAPIIWLRGFCRRNYTTHVTHHGGWSHCSGVTAECARQPILTARSSR